jgi:type III pantothenate kinase
MDINLLVLSVGNSRLAIGVFEAGELRQIARVANQDKSAWTRELERAWNLIAGAEQPAVAGASVNPAMNEQLEAAVKDICGEAVEWVGQQVDLPIKVLTENPAETGVDRVLGIAAAYEQIGRACVVVDAGTAITINVCNDKGEFLGGAIAPGVTTMLDSLHEKTARLPKVDFAVPTAPFGQNTIDAMRQGVYHGTRGMVKELVENYATTLGNWPEVIATGGDAKELFEGWELIHAVSPDLVLYGVALAYVNHHIKHPS